MNELQIDIFNVFAELEKNSFKEDVFELELSIHK
jgi:hypothetical protein